MIFNGDVVFVVDDVDEDDEIIFNGDDDDVIDVEEFITSTMNGK
jgi:hypothetical protein